MYIRVRRVRALWMAAICRSTLDCSDNGTREVVGVSLSSVRKDVCADEVPQLSDGAEEATVILIFHDSSGVAGLGSSTWYQVRSFFRPCLSEGWNIHVAWLAHLASGTAGGLVGWPDVFLFMGPTDL